MFYRLCLIMVFIACSGIALAEEFKVRMTDNWVFMPDVIEIAKGDSLIWVNEGEDTHTIVFEDKSIKGSDNIKGGKQFSSSFAKPGEYNYYCRQHRDQGMRGKVVVK